VRRFVSAAALLVSSSVLLLAAPKLTFSLGVLRRDGILIPFAVFSGHAWSAPWPTSDESVSLPIGRGDVPKPWWGPVGPAASWTAWMVADGSRRPLKIEKPTQVRVFCGGHIGLTTDYTGALVDPGEPTVAKDALAIAGADDLTLEPITVVSTYSADAKRIVATIADEFNAQEKIATTLFTNWIHPYGANQRARIPIELEAYYRIREQTPKESWVSYVEAIRRFPARPGDEGCGLITWVRGWVIERPDKKPDVHVTAKVTYCDREGVSFMQPFGQISVDGEHYWVYQMSSWRDEIYTVARMRPDEVRPVINVFGGGCPKDAVR